MWDYCTGPLGPRSGFSAWMKFLFTQPCVYLLVSAAINVLFLFAFGYFAVAKLWAVYQKRRRIRKDWGTENGENGSAELSHNVRKVTAVRPKFVATVALTGLGAFAFLIVLVWRFWVMYVSNWNSSSILDFTIAAIKFSAWFIFAALVGHEKRFKAVQHPLSLRVWWIGLFPASTWAAVSALLQFFMAASPYDPITLDDVVALVVFPISLFLLVIAIRGETGLQVIDTVEPDLVEPLIVGSEEEIVAPCVTEFFGAGLWSRTTWGWMDALLRRGSRNVFKASDIPFVAPDDRAEKMYELFSSHWPAESENAQHPVRLTLIRCFWPQLTFIGSLALARLCVMYVGPMLIQKFVNFSSGSQSSDFEGLYLTFILLVATIIQVISAHHYNFQSQKLGMLVRASLITSVYKKGLRLSSSARQAHGLGQIVQYMSVDVQQLSDVVIQLHNMWMLPLQITIALIILYTVVGISMIAGLITMVSLVVVTMVGSRQQKGFLTQLAKMRDLRLKGTSEVLNHMKIIKLQAWEEHFRQRVEDFRQSEYGWLIKYWVSLSGNIFSLWISPSLVSVVTFGTCMLLNEELTPAKVFTATATFRILMEPVRLFPQALIAISQAMVSLDRLDKYMMSKELDTGAVTRRPHNHNIAVEVQGGTFAWDDEGTTPTLRDVNISVTPGSLVAVVGMVGSGKSSLLASIMGEMSKRSGKVSISGSTAYVAQSAWIQSGTIEENITFGLPLDKKKYQEVVRVCSLERDFEIMDHGDKTEIGERGINLSGGQKQRIQLARAVYQDCDVYLLDDIFSAVDAHTGSALFKDCIRGALSSKTVLLVTHQIEFLHGADQILVMRDGEIVQAGKYDEIFKEGTDFEALVLAQNESLEKVGSVRDGEGSDYPDVEEEISQSPGRSIPSPGNGIPSPSPKSTSHPRPKDIAPAVVKRGGPSKLVEEEQRAVGRVSWRIYWQYLTKSLGWPSVVLLLTFQVFWQGLLVCGDYWLAHETSEDNRSQFRKGKFFGIYAAFGAGSWLMVLSRTALGTAMGLKTAQAYYLEMLRSVFRAPMSFFDTTPSGRILSRSSTDQTVIDVILAFTIGAILGVYFATFGILFVMIQVTWPIIFVIAPLLYTFFSYQAYFIPSSRELTRLDAVTKAPIIDHFSETVAGFTTIRCFQKEDQFTEVNVTRVNGNLRMDFHNNGANEWLGFRLEMIGTIILCVSALLLVTLPRSIIDPDLVGLSLSYGFALNLSLYWVVLLACQVENKMVAVERISQYTHVPSEAPLIIENSRPAPTWPKDGTIVLQDLKLRYRPDTPLVLHGLNLTFRGGESVGVVGRTGSGKSTLLQALFRLVEPAGGRILIDGVDIGTIGLDDLRSKLAIIPQEPTLFQGTVRSNIDPLGLYDDKTIWEGLGKCQLAHIIEEKPEKLDYEVADDGDNWSVGQRQLFCLGRALLKQSRILFLDEATASVDAQTDTIIQKTVKSEFQGSTVISIAHRIPSVMDSDKVLVLDAGKVKEYDSPSKLLQKPNSLFAALVREYAARAESEY